MGNEITVYQKMTSSTDKLMAVIRDEIGVKACVPFAVKAYEALLELSSFGKFTETDARKAANTFLSDLQTLTQGGVTTEDYDKIDFVKRGKVVCISARSEVFLRAAARKGYRITDTIVAIPKEDASTTFFEEHFYEGNIIYTLKDLRKQGDRKITAERIARGYFDRFICRLEVCEVKSGKRLLMTVSEISNEEVLAAAASSENGLYKSRWEQYENENGYKRNRKIITDEPNEGSIWRVWTAEMVNKTVMRRALKKVREILPELSDVILAFDTDVKEEMQTEPVVYQNISIKAIEPPKVDIFNISEAQQADVEEMFELYKANPKLAKDHAAEIIRLFEMGEDVQKICNEHYAEILNLTKSKEIYPTIKPFVEAVKELMGAEK